MCRHIPLFWQEIFAHGRISICVVTALILACTVTGRYLNTYTMAHEMFAKQVLRQLHRWLHLNLGLPLHGWSIPLITAVCRNTFHLRYYNGIVQEFHVAMIAHILPLPCLLQANHRPIMACRCLGRVSTWIRQCASACVAP